MHFEEPDAKGEKRKNGMLVTQLREDPQTEYIKGAEPEAYSIFVSSKQIFWLDVVRL